MAIDWGWLEELVVRHGLVAISEFASAHERETFRAAVFFVEPFDGVAIDLLLYTPAQRYRIDIAKQIEPWPEIAEAIFEATEADMDDARYIDGETTTTTAFLVAMRRAAHRLEMSALGKLPRAREFAVIVTRDAAYVPSMS